MADVSLTIDEDYYNPQRVDLTKSPVLLKRTYKKHTYLSDQAAREKVAGYILGGAAVRLKSATDHEGDHIESLHIEIFLDATNEAKDDADNKLGPCPSSLWDQLVQLKQLTYDGDLISKDDRDALVKHGMVTKSNGYQVITAKGIRYLIQLGKLK